MDRQVNYQEVSKLIDEWISDHKGETFDQDLICRHLNVVETQTRRYVAQKLWNEVRAKVLEKSNRLYKVLILERKEIDWVNASSNDKLDIKWPKSHLDESSFSFSDKIIIRPADLIVVAGVSNKGKSTFARNFLWENMDSFPCQMMVNEYAPARFLSIANRMDWVSPTNGDGKPKFRLIERYEDWKYAIEPDWINIIDWVALTDNFWEIRNIMMGIQETLRGGIAMIVLQKREGKTLGEGGGFSEDRASVYLNIDTDVLNVRKVKEFNGFNPNGKHYGFEIIDGAHFSHIRPVRKCKRCDGSGEVYIKGEGKGYCEQCKGSGWVDI